jgi:SAM-dependent methyltransferase
VGRKILESSNNRQQFLFGEMILEYEKPIFEGKAYPVFQNQTFADERSAKQCPVGNISLKRGRYGLVQNLAFDPALAVYGPDYNNEQALSLSFQSHLSAVQEIVRVHLGTSSIVEVGCGKGYFLEKLQADGFDVTGFDPAYTGNNPRIRPAFFNPTESLGAKGIVLRHVLEHIPNPHEFLAEIAGANGQDGLIYIEVPCFDWICRNNAWFDIYYEHVNYFTVHDFENIFGRVVSSGHIFGDQYIYVVADLASIRPVWDGSKSNLKTIRAPLLEIPTAYSSGQRHAVWGGSSKGVIFSMLMLRHGYQIDCVVDINPAKQNRFLPVTGLEVISPGRLNREFSDGDIVFIANPNYASEIVEMTENRFKYVDI